LYTFEQIIAYFNYLNLIDLLNADNFSGGLPRIYSGNEENFNLKKGGL